MHCVLVDKVVNITSRPWSESRVGQRTMINSADDHHLSKGPENAEVPRAACGKQHAHNKQTVNVARPGNTFHNYNRTEFLTASDHDGE